MADNIIHETNRNPTTARATQKTGHRTTKTRPRNPASRSYGRCVLQLGSPLERRVQKRWSTCPEKQAATSSAPQTLTETASKTRCPASERTDSVWLQNPVMDTTAGSRFDTKTLWGNLPHLPGLADLKIDTLQLPKARTQSPRTRRKSNSKLAQERLATYKKKPEEAVKPSFLLMKAALCSSLWCVEPGPQQVKRHCFTTGKVMTSSLLLVLSVFRRFVTGWACTLIFKIRIYARTILRPLWRRCWSILGVGLSWLLTAGWFTVAVPGDCRGDFAAGCRLNGCRRMHRSLILWSRSGTIASTLILPIMSLMIFLCSRKLHVSRLVICNPSKLYFDLFSKRPDSKYDLLH